MYKAKADGKARDALFSEAMDALVRHRVQVEAELRSALEGDEIAVHYQPIVTLLERRIVKVEASCAGITPRAVCSLRVSSFRPPSRAG